MSRGVLGRPVRVTRLGRFSRHGAIEASPSFSEGLILGAMVGAAIAGSTLWARVRRSRADTGRLATSRPAPSPDR